MNTRAHARSRPTMTSAQAGRPARLVGLILVLVAFRCGRAPGQETNTATSQPAGSQVTMVQANATEADCIRCHTCAWPTPQDRCLPICTRHAFAGASATPALPQTPDVIILNALEDAYLPVPFDHRGHAEMAEMGGGCVICHHHTPAGQPHPACRTCHGIVESDADVHKPALLGAYHQQCLNCHREWINERDCDVCHRPKATRNPGEAVVSPPTVDDILTQMHPPIPEPDTDLYRRRSTEPGETQIVFRHRDHAHRFGLRCVECHHERSCARCHALEATVRPVRTLDEHHAPCIRCHRRDMDLDARFKGRCQRCHWRPEQPKPVRFDHAQTGWPLGKYHQNRVCRECHLSVPFARLDRDCSHCHGEWSPATFDHRVTGQLLDENHRETNCAECHPDGRFDGSPTCGSCHDQEDDGIAFPARRPGPRVSSNPPNPDVRTGLDQGVQGNGSTTVRWHGEEQE